MTTNQGLPAWQQVADHIRSMPLGHAYGRVIGAAGLVVTCEGMPTSALGARCQIRDIIGPANTKLTRLAEVVGHKAGQTMLMPFGPLDGIGPGCRVYPEEGSPSVRVNQSWLGRVVDALGNPVDGKGPLTTLGGQDMPFKASPPAAGLRKPLGPKLDTGVRVFNTALPLCEGQRLGIFAGSGVGKSVLMGMLAQHSQADVNVIGLVGERGREVREFIDEQLGPQGLSRSVVVVATGDEPPLLRRQAAYLTTAIAEYFRDCGFNTLLMLDSVTRFALAQREVGLASGEPPTTRGFTPSVFAELPKLLERAGPGLNKGCISAIYTVLVEGGDMDEPVADAVRGILDGHVVLTRQLAERGHFPAVDVLKSVSRTVPQCLSQEENGLVMRLRRLMATYADMEELIRLGAYAKGADPQVDEAIARIPALEKFLQQPPTERAPMADSFKQLKQALQA